MKISSINDVFDYETWELKITPGTTVTSGGNEYCVVGTWGERATFLELMRPGNEGIQYRGLLLGEQGQRNTKHGLSIKEGELHAKCRINDFYAPNDTRLTLEQRARCEEFFRKAGLE